MQLPNVLEIHLARLDTFLEADQQRIEQPLIAQSLTDRAQGNLAQTGLLGSWIEQEEGDIALLVPGHTWPPPDECEMSCFYCLHVAIS